MWLIQSSPAFLTYIIRSNQNKVHQSFIEVLMGVLFTNLHDAHEEKLLISVIKVCHFLAGKILSFGGNFF